MSASGLNPTDEFETPVRVSKERLAEFDRLMAKGGPTFVQRVLEQRRRLAERLAGRPRPSPEDFRDCGAPHCLEDYE